jgi:predicted O-methyltransferase YrrM
LGDGSKIRVKDLGAGSNRFSSGERKIQDIIKVSCSSQKYSLLNQYFCSLTPAQTVIELGSCLGLNTCYLAEVTEGTLYSFEGAEGLVHLLKKNIESYKNIRLIIGDISETLPNFLKHRANVDFAFIDANHTYADTLHYFHQIMARVHQDSVIVIGDIHWSREMNRAWKEIIALDKVRLSLDFYECGALVFKEGLEKNHHILHY